MEFLQKEIALVRSLIQADKLLLLTAAKLVYGTKHTNLRFIWHNDVLICLEPLFRSNSLSDSPSLLDLKEILLNKFMVQSKLFDRIIR